MKWIIRVVILGRMCKLIYGKFNEWQSEFLFYGSQVLHAEPIIPAMTDI